MSARLSIITVHARVVSILANGVTCALSHALTNNHHCIESQHSFNSPAWWRGVAGGRLRVGHDGSCQILGYSRYQDGGRDDTGADSKDYDQWRSSRS